MTDRELLELAAKSAGYDTSHEWNVLRLKIDPPVETGYYSSYKYCQEASDKLSGYVKHECAKVNIVRGAPHIK